MKQVVINQLDGGFVVQGVINGQQRNSIVRTTLAGALKVAKKIFDADDGEGEGGLVAPPPPVQRNRIPIAQQPH